MNEDGDTMKMKGERVERGQEWQDMMQEMYCFMGYKYYIDAWLVECSSSHDNDQQPSEDMHAGPDYVFVYLVFDFDYCHVAYMSFFFISHTLILYICSLLHILAWSEWLHLLLLRSAAVEISES